MRLVHVITGLELGGAETMLYRLLRAMDPERSKPAVIALAPAGPMAERIAALGVPVTALGMTAGRPAPGGLWRLATSLRALAPDLVQTWMYHADLLGGLTARLVTRAPVVWGLHNSNLDPRGTRLHTRATVKACARLSRRVPRRILSCSAVAARLHQDLGYDPARMVVIPNGFDLDDFHPDDAHHAAVRGELGLAPDSVLIGLFARFHPQKDHATFIAAAARIAQTWPAARFILAGPDVTGDNPELAALIAASGAAGRFHLLGARTDMPRLTAALDLACTSAAFGEAFPLVIGEAMACAVPCVVTDVGDSALLVGATGRVVPPGDPGALAAAIDSVLVLDPGARRALGAAARAHIQAHYAMPAIAARYQALYDAVVAEGR